MAKNPTDATTRNVKAADKRFRKHAVRLAALEAKAAQARLQGRGTTKLLRYATVDIQKLADRLAILEARKG